MARCSLILKLGFWFWNFWFWFWNVWWNFETFGVLILKLLVEMGQGRPSLIQKSSNFPKISPPGLKLGFNKLGCKAELGAFLLKRMKFVFFEAKNGAYSPFVSNSKNWAYPSLFQKTTRESTPTRRVEKNTHFFSTGGIAISKKIWTVQRLLKI